MNQALPPLFPEQATGFARELDAAFFFVLGVTAFFTVLIFVLVFAFALIYRRRSTYEAGAPIEGSMILEVGWSVAPLGVLMIMFGWNAWLFFKSYVPPAGASDVFVVGKQWMWKIQHPTGQREINELHVPLGQAVKLTMTTEDVLHSFYIPAFRIKNDIVPGRYTSMWFRADRPGKYHLFCAEYCGNQHSGMIGWVYVLEPKDYEAWLSGGVTTGTMAQAGERLFVKLGCYTCHRKEGGGRGPVLDGVFGKAVELDGGFKVTADEAYVRESILTPNAKTVAGFKPVMPTFQGQVNEEQILQLIAYVKSLGEQKDNRGAKGEAGAKEGGGAKK